MNNELWSHKTVNITSEKSTVKQVFLEVRGKLEPAKLALKLDQFCCQVYSNSSKDPTVIEITYLVYSVNDFYSLKHRAVILVSPNQNLGDGSQRLN